MRILTESFIPEGTNVPHHVVYWWMRSRRLWVIQLRDCHENQIGAALYEPAKRLADRTAKRLADEHNVSYKRI